GSASGSCRSTSGPDAVGAGCSRPASYQGRSATRRSLIDLLAKGDAVELVEDRAMEALADAIGLRALGLGAAVVDVLDGEIELVFVALGAAKLGTAICQHARQPDAMLVV